MRSLALVTTALVLLCACAATESSEPAVDLADEPETVAAAPSVRPTPSPSTEAVASPSVAAVAAPFEFTVPTVDGGELDGTSLAGRDLALWFWAPW